MSYTCAGRGTCNPSCPMYGVCHCGCGARQRPSSSNNASILRTKGEPAAFQRGHNKRVNGAHGFGARWTRNGIATKVLLPDLQALLHVWGRCSTAEQIGMSEAWVRAVRDRSIKHTSWATAQRVAEAVRGSRSLDAEWRVEERELERRKVRQAQERRYRRDHAGRHEVTHDRHACTHCGAKLDNPHSLWMHARSKHGDTSQGKNQWSSFRVKR